MLPTPASRQRPGLDPLGAVGAAATVAAVLIPLTVGRSEGWPAWTWACLAAAILAVATSRWQRHLTDRGGTPLFDVTLLRTRSFRAGLLANAAFMCFFASFMFTLTLLLQAGLGLDAFHAGLVFAPAGVTYSLGALARWTPPARPLRRPRCARRSLLTAASLGLLVLSLHATDTHTSLVWIVLPTALASLGNGLVLPSLIGAALVHVAPERSGLAAGALNTAQQFASAIGVATVGALFFAAVQHSRDAGGYPVGMTWAAATDLALVLLVAALIKFSSRAPDRVSQ